MCSAPDEHGYFDQVLSDLESQVFPMFPPENLSAGRLLGSSSRFPPPLASGQYYWPSGHCYFPPSPTNWFPVPDRPLPPSTTEDAGFYPQTQGVPYLDNLVDLTGTDSEAGAGVRQDLGFAESPHEPADPEKQAAINAILAYLLDDKPALCCVQNPTREHALYYWISPGADNEEPARPDYRSCEQQTPTAAEMSPPVSFIEQIQYLYRNKFTIWKEKPKRVEVMRFIRFYSKMRWFFGHTQADVGVIMTSMSGINVSKALISRFENKKLCLNGMCEVKSMLESYISASEKYPDILERVCKEEYMLGIKKLRLSPWQKISLEKYYMSIPDKPNARQLLEISKHLHLPRPTIAMWFRNRRKKRNPMAKADRVLRTRASSRSSMQSVSPHVPTLHNLPYSLAASTLRSHSDALPSTSMSNQPQP